MQNSGMKVAAAAGCVLLAVLFILAAGSISHGKDKPVPRPRFYKPAVREDVSDIAGFDPRANTIAVADTYCIASYDFEQISWQGWTQADNTWQPDTFVRVEDFAGLGGGSHGRLVPIEGTKSLWFGTRQGSGQNTCSWPPGSAGYGNYWSQEFSAHVIPGVDYADTSWTTISYHLVCDTEEGHDFVRLCYDNNHGGLITVAEYSGVVDTIASNTFENVGMCFNAWFEFVSDGAVSDGDGIIDTDGAAILDSIRVYIETKTDSFVQDFEDFESLEPGETWTGYWHGGPAYNYGAYSGLANNLVDKDPCANNYATIITFFNGSPFASFPYPGLFDTPFCRGPSYGLTRPCQDEMVVSPPLDLRRFSSGCDENQDGDIPPGELDDMGGYMLTYSVYLDNPVENLVFHTWKVRNIVDGCPQPWLSDPLVRYYGDDGLWYRLEHDISGYVSSDTIQVAVGVVDMCYAWYGIYGDCAEHTPAPWFDNVKVSRYAVVGPQWAYQGADLFQDNFPSTDVMSSYVRADMAADISPPSYPDIVPGDSVVVSCWAPNAGGLDTLGTGEARIYFHCNVIFLGTDGKPDLFGPQLEGNYGSYASDDGDWTVLLCESARNSGGGIAPDRYCIDLNDSLFTRGYMIEYYFKAYDLDGISTTLPEKAEETPLPTWPPPSCCPERYFFEFTCLPTLRVVPSTLYVDDFDGRGTLKGLVQTYMDPTFAAIASTAMEIPDRYDVNQPSAMAGNSLGSRARPVPFKIAYGMVYWDCGDLSKGTIISAFNGQDKSDDITFLIAWFDLLTYNRHGLLVLGDNVATDLSQYSDGLNLMEEWCGTSLAHSSFFEMTGGVDGGGITSPLVTGVPGTPLEGQEFYLSGGCPLMADFDVLRPVGNGFSVLDYSEYGDSTASAAVFSEHDNATGTGVRTEWIGFSFMRIRGEINSFRARNEFLNACGRYWFHGFGASPDQTGDEIPAVMALAGNYPNPFNPVTRITFSLSHKSHVSLRIYDVAGRLVRVLVDETKDAGTYGAVWDGKNKNGHSTASGIYFCRMEADEYQRTVKMVLLR